MVKASAMPSCCAPSTAQKYDLPIKIARCFAFVGPYLPLDIHFAIGNFIRDGLSGGPIIVKGDGTPYRSYLYAADLAIWLWTVLMKGQICRPYNIGSEQIISIGDLAKTVASFFTPQTDVQILQEVRPGNMPERYVPSIERARREMSLENWITLEAALTKIILWLKG